MVVFIVWVLINDLFKKKVDQTESILKDNMQNITYDEMIKLNDN